MYSYKKNIAINGVSLNKIRFVFEPFFYYDVSNNVINPYYQELIPDNINFPIIQINKPDNIIRVNVSIFVTDDNLSLLKYLVPYTKKGIVIFVVDVNMNDILYIINLDVISLY